MSINRSAENFKTELAIGRPLKYEESVYSITRVVDKQLLHVTREAKLEAGKTISLEELLERCESDLLSIDE